MLYVTPLELVGPARGLAQAGGAARERVALEELEHYFLFMLLQEMRKSIPSDGLLDGGQGRKIFEEMLDDALSKEMARSGQLGVAKQIEQQLHLDGATRPSKGVRGAFSVGSDDHGVGRRIEVKG